jgi:branched-chain amino acid transport system substrate-binding protein
MRKFVALLCLSLALVVSVGAQSGSRTPGVYDDRIVIGYTMPMSGPIGFMGSQTAITTEAIFKKYNDQGGIFGRKLQLVKYDSGMDAGQALANYRKLILEDKVFAVLFGFGSFIRPAYAFFEEQKVPWLFPWAPPEDVMFPARKYLFSLFPTTASQMKVEANWIIEQGKWKSLACVYGDSASGKTGLEMLKEILKDSPVKLVATEAIPVDATSAAVQIAKISQAKPDIILIIGLTHAPAAVTIKEAKKVGLASDIMVQMSLIGPNIPKLLEGTTNAEGLYGAWWGAIQYPSSQSTETKKMKDLRLYLMKSNPETFNDSNIGGNVEHGLSVELMIDAIKMCGKDLTREGLIKALETMKNYDTGKGNYATFSPTRREGIAGGFVVQYKNGDWMPISKWINVDVGQ